MYSFILLPPAELESECGWRSLYAIMRVINLVYETSDDFYQKMYARNR
jgi:hypothetical protein